MDVVGRTLCVKFDGSHNSVYDLGNGIILERADAWEHDEGTAEQHKLVNHNVNKIDVNPQLARVIVAGENPFFQEGDLVFTHYLAFENMEPIELYGEEYSIIDDELVMFKIVDGEKVMPDGCFLAEQIIDKEMKLESGLIINVVENKKALTVKITHVPEKVSHIKLNDTVLSIDDFNYEFPYEGKKYVFIREEEIVAKLV